MAQLIAMLGIALFGLCLIVATLIFTHHEQQTQADRMREAYVEQQKEITRREVERVIASIKEDQKRIRPMAEITAKERADQAYATVENLYQTLRGTKEHAALIEIILSALRPVQFADGGYFFIVTMDGRVLLSAGFPEAEGLPLTALPSSELREAIAGQIELARRAGSGFFEYKWSIPGAPDVTHPKVSYIKRFDPLDWIIGSGVYLPKVESAVQQGLMEKISNIRYGPNGYFFINDMHGNVLAHGYQPEMVGASNWEYADSRGNKLFQDIRKSVEQPEGGFSYYWWRMPETGEERPKIAFAQAVPNWDWLIGTGLYLDEIEGDVTHMQNLRSEQSTREILLIGSVTIVLMLCIYLVIGILFRPLRRDISFFDECFTLAAQDSEHIDESQINFSELLKVAQNANAMLHQKEQFLEKSQRDQARRQELEIRLAQAQKMEAIGTLAGGIAHDFNNVLGVVLGYAELAREKVLQDASLTHHLNRVISAAERARDLTKQILAFSRQAQVEKIPVDISRTVREALKMLRSSIPSTIRIVDQVTKDPVTVWADPTQIHQIILNLCTNAYQAMEASGGTLTVTLREITLGTQEQRDVLNLPSGGFAEIIVSDTGQGILPEHMDKIFEPYFTTKEIGKGTGMGLAIIHGIVRESGGTITVDSIRGTGTTFHVYLPIISPESPRPSDPTAPYPGGQEHILLVDDEAALAETNEDLLTSLGYQVTTMTRSAAALAAFEKAPDVFDLIITDQTMPEITGAELARRVIAIRPDMPIILCTGYSNLIDDQSAKEIGIRKLILKPLTKAMLAHLIREVLDAES